jgi:chromosomal replication initiation ATPase DnaA
MEQSTPHVRIEDVQRAVCDYAQVSHADLIDACRFRELAVVRHVAMALCVHLTQASAARIGRAFKRDEQVVRYAAGKYGHLIAPGSANARLAVSAAFEALCRTASGSVGYIACAHVARHDAA